MKTSELKIRLERFRFRIVDLVTMPKEPFIMIEGRNGFVPIWLQLIDLNTLLRSPSAEADRACMDNQVRQMVHAIAFNKLRSTQQTLETWKNLDQTTLPIGSVFLANALGLRELVKLGVVPQHPDGDIVLYWHCVNDKYAFLGIWCDSEDAAKDFVIKTHRGCRQSYIDLELDPYEIEKTLFE